MHPEQLARFQYLLTKRVGYARPQPPSMFLNAGMHESVGEPVVFMALEVLILEHKTWENLDWGEANYRSKMKALFGERRREFPMLRSVNVNISGSMDLSGDSLRAPNLREFFLPRPSDLQPLLSFARSSGHALQTLICDPPPPFKNVGDNIDLPCVLSQLPNLNHLEFRLVHPRLFHRLLFRLHPYPTTQDNSNPKVITTPLCPKLTSFISKAKTGLEPPKTKDVLHLINSVLHSRWHNALSSPVAWSPDFACLTST